MRRHRRCGLVPHPTPRPAGFGVAQLIGRLSLPPGLPRVRQPGQHIFAGSEQEALDLVDIGERKVGHQSMIGQAGSSCGE